MQTFGHHVQAGQRNIILPEPVAQGHRTGIRAVALRHPHRHRRQALPAHPEPLQQLHGFDRTRVFQAGRIKMLVGRAAHTEEMRAGIRFEVRSHPFEHLRWHPRLDCHRRGAHRRGHRQKRVDPPYPESSRHRQNKGHQKTPPPGQPPSLAPGYQAETPADRWKSDC